MNDSELIRRYANRAAVAGRLCEASDLSIIADRVERVELALTELSRKVVTPDTADCVAENVVWLDDVRCERDFAARRRK